MVGFSLPKLLVLALIIGVIWYGFKWATQLDRKRRRAVKDDAKRAAPADEAKVNPFAVLAGSKKGP